LQISNLCEIIPSLKPSVSCKELWLPARSGGPDGPQPTQWCASNRGLHHAAEKGAYKVVGALPCLGAPLAEAGHG